MSSVLILQLRRSCSHVRVMESIPAMSLRAIRRTRGSSSIVAARSMNTPSANSASSPPTQGMSDAQRRSYDFYQQKRMASPLYRFRVWWNRNKKKKTADGESMDDLNTKLAWYATAIVVGVVGATYASVPLYKVFCQTTGFGGTTQRVIVGEDQDPPTMIEKMISSAMQQLPIRKAKVHTWTDEDAVARLASLRPVANAELITVHFDTTIGDNMPWSFEATQPYVKVVPGETALSFFRVTNHSNKAITGVATYNVHPPKVGLYFQKIQCFCFEEQRILPGETVDMPVFYFIDPEMLDDAQVSYVTDVTLSYTFFPTDMDDDVDEEEEKEV